MGFDFKRLDIYRKIPKDLTQPTLTGAIISVFCCSFILILIISELISYLSSEIVSELFVDNSESNTDRINVKINITLPRLRCEYVGLDIQDDMGRHEVGFVENTNKIDTEDGLGCHFEAIFNINRVPGNFHVSTHAADKQPDKIDMAHHVNSLTFGDEIKENLKGGFNSLKNKDKTNVKDIESHEYHMKIVPTIYEKSGKTLNSFQYTVAYRSYVSFGHSGRIMPAIWFRYDLTPITVKYSLKSKPFYSFLTMICAIVGGTFTVAGIVDSLIFTASSIIKKLELGKLS